LPKVIFRKRAEVRAAIYGNEEHDELTGEVLFYPFMAGSLLAVAVKNLPEDGFFGFHIHERGICEGTFATVGGHYGTAGQSHPRHTGDLPVLMSGGGFAYMMVSTNRFRPEQVVGRSVVIHAMPDDYRSAPAGDMGMRIACGVIRRQQPV